MVFRAFARILVTSRLGPGICGVGAGLSEGAEGERECTDLGIGVWDRGGVGGEGGGGLVGVEIVRQGGEGGDERRGERGRGGEEGVVDSSDYTRSNLTSLLLLCIVWL